MAKVIFEFDDNDENDEINLVVNRHKLIYTITQLSDFYRKLYNGKLYTDDIITVKDNKVLTSEDYVEFQEKGEFPVKGTQSYISTDYLENELDNMLSGIRDMLD